MTIGVRWDCSCGDHYPYVVTEFNQRPEDSLKAWLMNVELAVRPMDGKSLYGHHGHTIKATWVEPDGKRYEVTYGPNGKLHGVLTSERPYSSDMTPERLERIRAALQVLSEELKDSNELKTRAVVLPGRTEYETKELVTLINASLEHIKNNPLSRPPSREEVSYLEL